MLTRLLGRRRKLTLYSILSSSSQGKDIEEFSELFYRSQQA